LFDCDIDATLAAVHLLQKVATLLSTPTQSSLPSSQQHIQRAITSSPLRGASNTRAPSLSSIKSSNGVVSSLQVKITPPSPLQQQRQHHQQQSLSPSRATRSPMRGNESRVVSSNTATATSDRNNDIELSQTSTATHIITDHDNNPVDNIAPHVHAHQRHHHHQHQHDEGVAVSGSSHVNASDGRHHHSILMNDDELEILMLLRDRLRAKHTSIEALAAVIGVSLQSLAWYAALHRRLYPGYLLIVNC
jgi:hypothetical protein